MDLIRIGNDIGISWSLFTKQGDERVPYLLEGRDLLVLLDCAGRHFKVDRFTISENVLSFVYYGKDQFIAGDYLITLIENPGKKSQLVLDARDVFSLVRRSWGIDGENTQDVETILIELSSDIGPQLDEQFYPTTITEVNH